ncbi:4'-phosphopantetheinyl transferase family protein [Tenacibaculum piscium]|uniref:4'-phosphopantetheinyl transferase family protein n=1 Tax=Tenacibaculum piscium TaxID=1458515 RepID=UPI001F1F5BDF|nr:4'-phosphopantetheinyl transferase superfamily protein [Tenacibaculum piscium]
MKEVNIFYSKIIDRPISRNSALLKNLPKNLLTKNKNYKRWKDRELNLLGKLLLIEGLKLYDIELKCLKKLKYNKYGKPYLDLDLDFNISHSGEYVLCALSRGLRLGIDIEKIEKLDLNSITGVFTKNELFHINSSEKKEKTFYDYWTSKESVVKAIGRGLSIPLEDIEVYKNQQLSYDNDTWYIQKVQIDNLYSSHIAFNYKQIKLNYYFIDFYNCDVNLMEQVL